MSKRKILTLIASIVLLLSFSVTVFATVLTEAIKERHDVSLSSDIVKVSSSENGTYATSMPVTNGMTVWVDNYKDSYDLIAVSANQSDGFVISEDLKTKSHTVSSSNFKPGVSYYVVAVMHHPYNRFVNSFWGLELLNNEYRHSVINDDLKIGNITDLYDSLGNYIGDNENYDINDGVYDYYGTLVKNLIDIKTLSNDGPITYKVEEISTSTIVNMKNIRRKGIYDINGTSLTGEVVLATKTTINPNAFYDRYGRKLNQFYCLEQVKDLSNNVVSYKESNYLFTKDLNGNDQLIINGNILDQSQMDVDDTVTINLKNCYYENSIIIDNAYKSNVYKNIYLLNNIIADKDLTLMMPCNINLLNNNITLKNDIEINHYYHGNYIIDNLKIGSNTGNFVDENGSAITSASEHKLSFVCPNGTFTKPNDIYINNVTGKDNLLNDALAFAKSFFYNQVIEDGYELAASFEPNETYFERSDSEPYVYTKKLGINSTNFSNGTYYHTNKYSLTYNNPILPVHFYDEDIVISYKYSDNADFVVEKETNNQIKDVVITITSGNNSISSTEKIWIVGTSKQAINDTIAKAIEHELNEGFKTTSSIRTYFNYDAINSIVGANDVTFEVVSGAKVSDVYLAVGTPKDTNLNEVYTLYTRSGEGTEGDPYVYTKVSTNTAIDNNETYYGKYLLFERASYTFSNNAYGIVNVILDECEHEIKIPLYPTTENNYIEYLKQEIGQIYFSNSEPYILKQADELLKYDVKSITYTPKIKDGDNYLDTDILAIIDNELSNLGMNPASEYYLLVEVELNDGSTTSFYTDKLLSSASSSGGDGENSYQSSLFEKEFNDMSIFIGLSDDFELEGNVYYYLEITSPNSSVYSNFLGLYQKIIPASIDSAKIIVSGSATYYYLNDDLTLTQITSSEQVVDLKPIYATPSADDNIQNNYRMVFLTNSNNIPSTSTLINVKAYISDNRDMTTGRSLIDTVGDGKINLYDGLFDYNKNPIYELTNGKEKYLISYDNSKNVTSVTYINSLGEEIAISSTEEVDISGFYCNGYVYDEISNGEKIIIKNGIFSNKTLSLATTTETYTHNKITFTIAYLPEDKVNVTAVANMAGSEYYDKNGALIDNASYDLANGLYSLDEENNIKPLKNVLLYDSSFTFTYDNENNCTGYTVNYTVADSSLIGRYYRINTQQTTFYDLTGAVKTIYVQNYSFTVPGVYRPIDFNAEVNVDEEMSPVALTGEELITNKPEVFDMYKALMDLYGQSNGSGEAKGFKEMNGSKYFLLVSDLENAEVVAKYNAETGAIEKDSSGNYINLDCSDTNGVNRVVDIVPLIKLLPKLKYLYISNATFAYYNDITNVEVDGKNMTSKIVELSLDHIRGYDEDTTGLYYEVNFKNYTNLEKLIITNSLLDNRTRNGIDYFGIYRKLKYLDLSNNLFTNINFITTGVELTYVNLSNNEISVFEPLRELTKLTNLYVNGNNTTSSVTLGSNTIYPYGTPRLDGTTLYGQINIPTLIYVSERNDLVDTDYETFVFETLNDGEDDYLYAAYTVNAISYLNKYYNGLSIDLALIDKAGYTSSVYVSKNGSSYNALTSSASTQYNYPSGYFETTDKGYIHAIIGITKGSYTVYREIYYKTN